MVSLVIRASDATGIFSQEVVSDQFTDWTIRRSLAGTLNYNALTDSSTVYPFLFTNESGAFDPTRAQPLSSLIRMSSGTGYRTGTDALEIEENGGTTDPSPNYIHLNFDSSYVAGNLTPSVIVPPGVPVINNFVVWSNTARLTSGNWGDGDGLKIAYVTVAGFSFSAQEMLFSRFYGRQHFQLENSAAAPTSPWRYRDFGATIDEQPGKDGAVCLYPGSDPVACLYTEANEWLPIRLTLIGGTAGASNTIARGEVLLPGDQEYTQFFYRDDLYMPFYEGGNGYSGFILINRNEHKSTNSATGMLHRFNDWIVTKGTLTPPPKPDGDFAPGYARSATAKRWNIVPGSTAGTQAAAWSGVNTVYGGSAVDQRARKQYVAPGGHSVGIHNAILTFDWMQESCAWVREFTGTAAGSAGDYTTNGTGAFSNGSRISDHTYNSMAVGDDGNIYFPALTTGDGPLSGQTFWTTNSWKWDPTLKTNSQHGYSQLSTGRLWPGAYPFFNTMVSSCSCYDPVRRNVWFFGQDSIQAGPTGDFMWWRIDTNHRANGSTGQFYSLHKSTSATGNPGGTPAWATVVPRLNVLLLQMTGGGLLRMDLDTKVWSTCTVTGGTNAPVLTTESAHYVLRADQVIGRKQNDGANLRVLTLPSTASGTYAWASVSPVAGGVTPPEATEAAEHHMYTKFNVIQDIGNGNALLGFTPTVSSSTYFYIVDGPL